jgi:F-box-like
MLMNKIDRLLLRSYTPMTVPRPQYCPINQLPTELLLYIFHCGSPGVKERLKLTHICQRWREIAIASGSLWTSIDIIPDPTASDEQFDNFISLLGLQLGRTHNLPLDVVWHIRGSRDRTAVVINHIRQNGPFHRWRSLTLSVISIYFYLFTDGFPTLESLIILSIYHGHQVLQALNLTATSKLRTLHIRLSGARDEDLGRFYGPMLNLITRLILPGTTIDESVVRLPPFPANITDIEAERRSTHPFPYVQTYKLTRGVFRKDHIIDLQNLTTLIITSSFAVYQNCRLVLPSLRQLVCAHITLGEDTVLDAPMLEDLEFCDYVTFNSDFTRSRFKYIGDILNHPGYLLSPGKSLSLDLPLPADLIVTMISRCPRLERLVLRFNAELTVWRFMVAIMGNTTEPGIPCPRLSELMFRFARGYRDFHAVEWWRDRAAQIVRGRAAPPVVLNIYGVWDEGETFTLLA